MLDGGTIILWLEDERLRAHIRCIKHVTLLTEGNRSTPSLHHCPFKSYLI
jgi:hypothetical protein